MYCNENQLLHLLRRLTADELIQVLQQVMHFLTDEELLRIERRSKLAGNSVVSELLKTEFKQRNLKR